MNITVNIPQYAILSHNCAEDEENEVKFDDLEASSCQQVKARPASARLNFVEIKQPLKIYNTSKLYG
jgi:hypothetical protein